jgi:signal transduction histidine kinase
MPLRPASFTIRRPAWLRYAAAVAITSCALAVKLLLVPLISADVPFLVFFAAVMASAVVGGLGPGLLATALAAVFDSYFFTAPFGRFGFGNAEQQIRVALFVVESALISVICTRLEAARETAEANAAEARELERRMLEIADEEQRRIGHDLHDGLGQHLFGITLIAKRLEQRLATAGSSEAEDACKLTALARTAVAWSHDLSRTLSPPALAFNGLPEALRELAGHAEGIFDIDCTYEQVGDPPDVDVPSRVHLYRIAQEAVSNAVRHGKAKHVDVRLEQSDGSVVLRIVDDGIGIDPAVTRGAGASTSGGGMGLRIMRYRARIIGAAVEVRRLPAGGTEVACRFAPPRQEPERMADGSR